MYLIKISDRYKLTGRSMPFVHTACLKILYCSYKSHFAKIIVWEDFLWICLLNPHNLVCPSVNLISWPIFPSSCIQAISAEQAYVSCEKPPRFSSRTGKYNSLKLLRKLVPLKLYLGIHNNFELTNNSVFSPQKTKKTWSIVGMVEIENLSIWRAIDFPNCHPEPIHSIEQQQ